MILTVGHSTHPLEEFTELLETGAVARFADGDGEGGDRAGDTGGADG